MAITPQAIKDQEFQSKFRGYDTIEVKAYLELIAEEFFEQLEEVRSQGDTIEALEEEKEELEREKRALEDRVYTVQKEADEKIAAYSNKDDAIIVLEKELEEFKKNIEQQEEEKGKKDKQIAQGKELLDEKDQVIQKLESERKDLEKEMEKMAKQLESLDNVEVDFKSTLIMAQKFSNDIKEKSEKEAQEIIDLAIEESEKQRKETLEELSRYPEEIERLKEKRNKVRDELAAVLTSALDNLKEFNLPGSDEDDDLFQKIDLPSLDEEEGDKNVFDDMGVDFSAPQAGDGSEEEAVEEVRES